MQEAVTSSTKLLCPNGHGLQGAKRAGTEWLLACECTRGNSLVSTAKTRIQTPAELKKPVAVKPVDPVIEETILDMPISTFSPEVEYEERAPQEQEVGSEYVRQTAREAGEYAAFLGKIG